MYFESRPIAMLIDGDNAQPSLIKHILAETAKYGVVTTRRIYGDWTAKEMSGWKGSLHSYAIQPIQQFRYTVGKNATDSALIIDAMDLLHSETVDGFCIVSSDSDYTRLATRIREQGLFVMGIGRSDTPDPFVKACQVFVYTENLAPKTGEEVKVADPSSEPEEEVTVADVPSQPDEEDTVAAPSSSDWTKTVTRAIEMATQDDGWAFLGSVGNYLRQLDPAFDPRSYEHKRLSSLIKSCPDLFETKEHSTPNGASLIYVRLKD